MKQTDKLKNAFETLRAIETSIFEKHKYDKKNFCDSIGQPHVYHLFCQKAISSILEISKQEDINKGAKLDAIYNELYQNCIKACREDNIKQSNEDFAKHIVAISSISKVQKTYLDNRNKEYPTLYETYKDALIPLEEDGVDVIDFEKYKFAAYMKGNYMEDADLQQAHQKTQKALKQYINNTVAKIDTLNSSKSKNDNKEKEIKDLFDRIKAKYPGEQSKEQNYVAFFDKFEEISKKMQGDITSKLEHEENPLSEVTIEKDEYIIDTESLIQIQEGILQ
jgi:hypothetical protein